MLVLLSGPVGAGKTTMCQRLAQLAREQGLAVGGVLTPAIVENGVKVGIQAACLYDGEYRTLARSDCELGGARVGRYSFDDEVLEWMASRCAESLASDALVTIDEIGPLELVRGLGLARLIPLLAEPRRGKTVVVVREALLGRLAARLAPGVGHVVMLDPLCRAAAWTNLAALLAAKGEETTGIHGDGKREERC